MRHPPGVRFFRSLQMVLAAGAAGLCGQMSIHQQAADIVIRIPTAALVNAVGPFPSAMAATP